MRDSFISIFISILNVLSANADSTFFSKNPKNHFQIGITSLNFEDGYGFKAGSRFGMGLQGGVNFNYSQLIKNRFVIGLNYFGYFRNDYREVRGQKDKSEYNHGDVLLKAIKMFDLKIGKIYRKKINHQLTTTLTPSLHIAARYGEGDEIFLGTYPGGFDFAATMVNYKGYGVGLGAEISILCYKHFSLSANFNYWYIFEKRKFEENTQTRGYYVYNPPRNMLSFQPKIGLLF